MAGDVANDSLPIARRLSALQGIKTMMEDQIKLAGTSMQGGQQAPQENQLKPAKPSCELACTVVARWCSTATGRQTMPIDPSMVKWDDVPRLRQPSILEW